MTGGTSSSAQRAALLALLEKIPAGRLATHGQIAAELRMMRPHVAALLQDLNDDERTSVPWHRVVADGGAIGRHKHRDAQMARLRAEGIAVAPAGIVDELSRRRIADFSAPGAAIERGPATAAPSRSRGMKGRP